MNDKDLQKHLEDEVTAARHMESLRPWLEGFFARKDRELFDAFKLTTISDPDRDDKLVGIHHATKSLDSLKEEMLSVINTGKMAAAQLKEAESEGPMGAN